MRPSQWVNNRMKNPNRRWVQPKVGIKAGWGIFEGSPDFIVGSAESKSECSFFHYFFGEERVNGNKVQKSFLQELHERGYDVSTLKFSIERYK